MIIKGLAYVVGDHVDTDQIIPAKHLVYRMDDPEERALYGKYAMSGVPDESAGLPHGNQPLVSSGAKSDYTIIIGGRNFGCGSSREHAPMALAEAGIEAVIAQSYARIFYRNSVDSGNVLPVESEQNLCMEIFTGDELEINMDSKEMKNKRNGNIHSLKSMDTVAEIVSAGGLFGYARENELIGDNGDEKDSTTAGRRHRAGSNAGSCENSDRCWYPGGFAV
ncbi:3-isopropylmalate dehydratase [bacterium]|nr:3-isopropylmalate dehydratase [bacterium]